MAHVIHSINATLGGGGHHLDAIADDEHHSYAAELLSLAEAILLGRNTFDLFMDFWPEATGNEDLSSTVVRLARELEKTLKYVVLLKYEVSN